MAIVLQPFLEPEYSGVMFTSFRKPGEAEQLLIEYVEGECEKLVQGEVDPTRLWVRREPSPEPPAGTPALSSGQLAALVDAGLELEQQLGRPQDVEWCLCRDRLYLVQTRDITVGQGEATHSGGGEVILEGVGASPGIGSGDVHLVFNIEDADELPAGSVLTTTMTNPDMVPAMQRSAAIVTDVGGLICHAAIVSRELGLPCVVGSGSATRDLAAGMSVSIDGSSGRVYRGDFDDYRRYSRSGRPYYGRTNQYGTRGSYTQKSNPDFFHHFPAAFARPVRRQNRYRR